MISGTWRTSRGLQIKKTQMQSACAMWGQDMARGFASHLSCSPKLQEDLTPRVRPFQTRALRNCWVTHQAPAGQQRLILRRNQVSFRICTSGVLPLLCCHTCHSVRVHPPALRALYEKYFLPPCWMQLLGPHFPPVNHHRSLSSAFSARTHVLRSKCYSEFFRIISFPFVHMEDKMFTWPLFPLKPLHFHIWVCFQGTNFFLTWFNHLVHALFIYFLI